MLPLGSKVFCHGYGQWGAYTFTGIIEKYSYDDNDSINGYKVRSGDRLDLIWLRDAELVT